MLTDPQSGHTIKLADARPDLDVQLFGWGENIPVTFAILGSSGPTIDSSSILFVGPRSARSLTYVSTELRHIHDGTVRWLVPTSSRSRNPHTWLPGDLRELQDQIIDPTETPRGLLACVDIKTAFIEQREYENPAHVETMWYGGVCHEISGRISAEGLRKDLTLHRTYDGYSLEVAFGK